MTRQVWTFLAGLAFATCSRAFAQDLGVTAPTTVQAGSAFSITVSGSGSGTLYIVGPDQVMKKNVQLGNVVPFHAGSLVHAGQYSVILSSPSGTQSTSLDVLPVDKPAKIKFLAEPSRLPVDLPDGITGTVYVFDPFGNLIVTPTPVTFEVSAPSGALQTQSATTRDGAAWIRMSTTKQQGIDNFTARIGDLDVSRSVHQVAGDPCQLTMTAHQSGQSLLLQTAPVRDCSGNPVPDGTIVTFSEAYDGGTSTADVPLKHGIASVDLPVHDGGMLSVATGVVMGNQIRWGK
jgi:hypothetical protein